MILFSFIRLIMSLMMTHVDISAFFHGFAEKCVYSALYEVLKAVCLLAGGLLWKKMRPHLPVRCRNGNAKLRVKKARQKAAVKPPSDRISVTVKAKTEDAKPIIVMIPHSAANEKIVIIIL